MVFSSAVFLFVFLPVAIIGYFFVCRNTVLRNIWLLILSLGFYAWGEPVYVFFILFSIVVNWIGAECIRRTDQHRRLLFVTVIAFNVLCLLFFKYTDFFIGNLNHFLISPLPELGLRLPLGISFFTFQVISFQIDEYRSPQKQKIRFMDFMLYAMMFPQLVAGPIVRYADVAHDLGNRKISLDDYSKGIQRFVLGLSKKLILADHLAVIADNAYYLLDGDSKAASMAWIGAIAYTLQIYFDFSGSSDMAIGIGRMFGFSFPENFNYPYVAASITEFWKRWHMTLSGWFRDYIYIPLGGNRKGTAVTIRNLFIVWILTGFWHGAGWNFIFWGLGYFVLLMIERFVIHTDKGKGVLGHIYTLFFVNLLWVVFRSADLSSALLYIGRMFGSGGALYDYDTIEIIRNAGVIPLIAILLCFPWWKVLCDKVEILGKNRKNIGATVSLLLFIVCMSMCVAGSYSPFIYFNF